MAPSDEMTLFGERRLRAGGQDYRVVDPGVPRDRWIRLPYAHRVLAENAARCAGRPGGSPDAVEAVAGRRTGATVPLFPARLLLQDLLGVPLLTDLAALRDAVAEAGVDPTVVDSQVPVDLVIDHSLRVDSWATADAHDLNLRLEHERNTERFAFLRWCESAFANLRVIPPGKGIMHQINVERLARVVWSEDGSRPLAYPDTVLGTDSHTPMVNGLGVLGWGVGGIEAEAVMLGQPATFALPRVVGVELRGRLPHTTTPTDLVLRLTELLRAVGVVGAFVEFFGPGLDSLGVPDRTTIANMAPEQGATATFFPIDARTSEFLAATGRSAAQVALVEAYAHAQGIWRNPSAVLPDYDLVVSLDLATVSQSIAGPRRPEDRRDLDHAKRHFGEYLLEATGRNEPSSSEVRAGVEGSVTPSYAITDGAVVIAAIASCTNTSNPRGMVTAGLVARNAVRRGLQTKPWVKTSLTPGSQVTASLLERAGLQKDLDRLGFHVAGFGCATCNGMSGPLDPEVSTAISESDLLCVAVVSSNRNFAGRIHPDVRASYLAAPALVVAYALTGTMLADLVNEPLGLDSLGQPVWLSQLWPEPAEVDALVAEALEPSQFDRDYDSLHEGGSAWRSLLHSATRYPWDPESTYIRRPPFFDAVAHTAKGGAPSTVADIVAARPLAILGDSVTTDDISPSGAVPRDSAAGRFLEAKGVSPRDFNSYGTRRGNYEVAMRATFANRRLRNVIVDGREGSLTRLFPDGIEVSVFDAAEEYARRGTPLVVIAGRDYGCGSSRDWAAKGPALLGVRAVIASSFERIHRANLVGMGILPLQLPEGVDAQTLCLDGSETFDITVPTEGPTPGAMLRCVIHRVEGDDQVVSLRCRVETEEEATRLRHGGLLPTVRGDVVRASAGRGAALVGPASVGAAS